MKLEKLCCPHQLAKKLKAFGIKQDGAFTWVYDPFNGQFCLSGQPPEALSILRASHPKDADWDAREAYGWYSAFTASELGAMLPESFIVDGVTFYLQNDKVDDCWQVCYSRIDRVYPPPVYTTEVYANEAEARAEMLIILLEALITTPAEVNQRLNPQPATL